MIGYGPIADLGEKGIGTDTDEDNQMDSDLSADAIGAQVVSEVFSDGFSDDLGSSDSYNAAEDSTGDNVYQIDSNIINLALKKALILVDRKTLTRAEAAQRAFLGGGSFGRVYAARHRWDKGLRAVKVVKVNDVSNSRIAYKEARNMVELNHTNIVKYFEANHYTPTESLILVMELCDGTLSDLVARGDCCERSDKVHRDIASALAYLERRGKVHRDLKLDNVFLRRGSGEAVLGDFGLAAQFSAHGIISAIGKKISCGNLFVQACLHLRIRGGTKFIVRQRM